MTTSLPLCLWTAASTHDNLVAIIHPQSIGDSHRLSISLYDSVAGTLQSTLTTSLPQEDAVIKKLLFVSPYYVCVLLNTSTIIVWNVMRGVVVHSLKVQDGALDVCSGNEDSSLFVLTAKHKKLYIHEYSLETAKVIRKIKCGMHVDDNSNNKMYSLAVSSTYVAIRQDDKVRVLSLETGSKVAKLKVSASNDGMMSMEDSNLAIVTSTGIVLFTVQKDSAETVAQIFPSSLPISFLEIKYNLLLVRTSSSTLLYEWPMISSKEPLKPIAALSYQDGVDAANISFSTDAEQLVTVLYSPGKGVHVQRVSYKNENSDEINKTVVGFPADDDDQNKTEDKSASKRSKLSSYTTTLGPGQAGGEALHASDRSSKKPRLHQDDQEEDVSIAQRLQQLAQEMERNNDEQEQETTTNTPKFNTKKATTESLSHLLSQALSSNDEAMLELSLGVRDKRTISTSIQELDAELVGLLLTKLTWRLSHKPNRAADLSEWLALVLSSGKVQNTQQLRPLRNLLQERVKSFPHLLQLEGRLSVLAAMK